MLGIQIEGEFLDLPPGTTMELERENPFLQLNNQLVGEYSLPFSVIANEKNLRLLNYAAVAQQQMDTTGVDALLYNKSIQVGAGKVKIEKASINLNKTSKGIITCYFLGAASSFWQDIKDLKMRQVAVGGDRSFAWAGLSTITTGFWKHIHEVAAGAPGDYDYAIFPVINTGWIVGDVYPPLMNKMYYDAMEAFPMRFPNTYGGAYEREMNRIVPFPYLKYVLEKVFEQAGWSVSGDILSDADFEKITMINFRAIDYCFAKVSGGGYTQVYRNPVVFNLQDHLPDITVAAFLIALQNRFGWWYDFDVVSKKVTIRQLSELVTAQPVDMTDKASPLLSKLMVQERPVYALRNQFAFGGDGAPDFNVISLQGDVDKTTDLPAASESIYGHVYRVAEENNYYICQQNPDDEVWQWYQYAYNIYDYAPDGANQDITTAATLAGNERYDAYMDLIPRLDNQGEWLGRTDEPASWGIHLVFYFGPRDNKSGDPLPFASHHMYDSNGYTLAAWSLAFKAVDTAANEVGLYDLNWKGFLDMISGREEFEVKLYLPIHTYLQLRFSDRIVINGVHLFIKQIKSSIPYTGVVNCVCVRV